MSIINTTPDSFYDGGKYSTINDILRKIEGDLNSGATFFDIGGYSSRPNAKNISEKEELERTSTTIKEIHKRFPEALISIDSFRGKITQNAIDHGACMINDISAWEMDDSMLNTVINNNVPYILMHMKGTPQNMQYQPSYEDVTKEVLIFFTKKIEILTKMGINDIIIDPGFGFGKSIANNYKLIADLSHFKILNRPILVGISRKSMITKFLKIKTIDSLNSTTALNMYALINGAKILRVHDVTQAMECLKIHQEINNQD